MSRRVGHLAESGRPLRVLQLHQKFELGGKEARLVRLMNHWGERMTHDILVAEPDVTGAQALFSPELKVRFLDEPTLAGQTSLAKLIALARLMRGYDLVLSFNWGAIDGVMAHRLFRRLKRLPPLVHHEDGFDADEADARLAARNRYRQIALKGAYALVVPSTQLAHIAQAEWKQRAEKVHQIPNGIDVPAYAGRRHFSAIPGLEPDGRLVVGTVATFRLVKNLPLLVRAVAPLRDRLRLVIVGDGQERAAVIEEAERQGMADLVLPGVLPGPEDYVGAFDIFALSSDSEQYPRSLIEAMAAGLPVVATDVGDTLGMLSPKNRPFVVPPGAVEAFTAALETLADDTEMRRSIGEANRKRALRCFDEAVMIQLYTQLYGAAIGNELALF
jgi:glycosyltransferase involved in cell wall biosynthesis